MKKFYSKRGFDVREAKNAVRSEYSKLRSELSAELCAERDAAICDCAVGLASFRFADFVLLYAAMKNEIEIYKIAQEALRRGKKVAFPISNKTDYTMEFHFITSLDDLKAGAYGILEPSRDAPVYDCEKSVGSAVCFVPGLVFDKNGYRLGYGKGFYDRYISKFRGTSIGVVYKDFILPSIPTGKYDIGVDILLCENGVITTSEN